MERLTFGITRPCTPRGQGGSASGLTGTLALLCGRVRRVAASTALIAANTWPMKHFIYGIYINVHGHLVNLEYEDQMACSATRRKCASQRNPLNTKRASIAASCCAFCALSTAVRDALTVVGLTLPGTPFTHSRYRAWTGRADHATS